MISLKQMKATSFCEALHGQKPMIASVLIHLENKWFVTPYWSHGHKQMLGPWEERYRNCQRDHQASYSISSKNKKVCREFKRFKCPVFLWNDSLWGASSMARPAGNCSLSDSVPWNWEVSALSGREIYGNSWLLIKSWSVLQKAAGRDVPWICWIYIKMYANIYRNRTNTIISTYIYIYIILYRYIYIYRDR